MSICGIIFAAFLFLFSHSRSLFTPLSFSCTFSVLFLFCTLPPPLYIFLLPPPLVLLLLHSPFHFFLLPLYIFLYIFMLSTFYIFISFSHPTKQPPPVSTSKVIVRCCNIFWPHSIGIRNLPCLVCNWYGAYTSAFFNLSNLYTQAAPALNLLLATI